MTKKGYYVALFTVIISVLLLFVPMAGAETIVERERAEDNGPPADGSVLTVGELGDSISNPLDPYQTSVYGPYYDYELYNLIPFVSDENTSITVYTLNPPDDDNVTLSTLRERAHTRNLISFVSNEGTSITVYTFTPPNNHNNIYFSELFHNSTQTEVRPSFVVPEFPFGPLAGLITFLAALIASTKIKSRFLS